MAKIAFYPNLAFGKLEVISRDGRATGEIPSWLIDQPEVISALEALAKAGGTALLATVKTDLDVVVDTDSGTLTFEAMIP